ncbi:(2Fe-2S)-binding protein [Cloacibacillus sp.]|uniref:(2Fe-2S)-binding protein n=1 Tax=Cloacibacillus sp. TaxID=2049023 RepID=UPI0025C72D8F|nr:(2Fe-2S)-binding protein [Cloacibacillus sp.]MCC8057249.1 (2Fe-2S)-binding protein [Cloacibacillus sp.]
MSNNNETIICRCEDITVERIRECIAAGCTTINEIKRETRAGMGPCQGRTCRMLIAQELSCAYNIPLDEVLLPTFRIPAVAVSIEVMAEAKVADDGIVSIP